MERKDLDSLTLAEVEDVLTKQIDTFKEEVSKIKDMDELEGKLKELDEIMAQDKEYISGVIYELPPSCDFQSNPAKAPEHFSASQVYNNIIYFLNKNEVEWRYTLGLMQLIDFWKSTPKEISYAVYDSTLRTLNQGKYKGYEEYKNILVINEYMSACHESYTKDTQWFLYHSNLMNALLDQQKLIEKENGLVDDDNAVMQDIQNEMSAN